MRHGHKYDSSEGWRFSSGECVKGLGEGPGRRTVRSHRNDSDFLKKGYSAIAARARISMNRNISKEWTGT